MTLKKQLIMLRWAIFNTTLCASFIYFFFDELGDTVAYLGGFFFLLFLLPVIIIHYNYYQISRNYIYEFTENYIIITKGEDELTINIDEIESVEFAMTANQIKKSGLRKFPFEGYYYASIKLKSSPPVILTCLICPQLESVFLSSFPKIPVNVTHVFYPYIHKPRLS